ncbi:MAG: CoA transferase [Alphaproteobacteria bacterium]
MALLKGIRVISFNHFLMGPMGIQYLADLGADVIAVEPIAGAFQRKWSGADKTVDGQSMLFLCGNRIRGRAGFGLRLTQLQKNALLLKCPREGLAWL